MNCPSCSNLMILTRATAFGDEYHYCRTCKKELNELVKLEEAPNNTIMRLEASVFHVPAHPGSPKVNIGDMVQIKIGRYSGQVTQVTKLCTCGCKGVEVRLTDGLIYPLYIGEFILVSSPPPVQQGATPNSYILTPKGHQIAIGDIVECMSSINFPLFTKYINYIVRNVNFSSSIITIGDNNFVSTDMTLSFFDTHFEPVKPVSTGAGRLSQTSPNLQKRKGSQGLQLPNKIVPLQTFDDSIAALDEARYIYFNKDKKALWVK